MRFRILSHAGLQVTAGGKEMLCDPWLLGSAFWRSWWNLPQVSSELVESLKPDVIYLTHIHWDHFHGPSLKLFPRDTKIVIPYDRYERMRRDLEDIGFHDIIELKHGERYEIAPGFSIRSFHIAPVILDSALVVEADGVVLLNAADAKLAGAPLAQITKDYPKIDFVLRSHSSANARSCYHVINREDELLDDREHYLRAFSLFMERVKPRYAIPFASNHCHLHKDTLRYNALVQTPSSAVEYFNKFRAANGLSTEIQVLVSGEGWDSETGFFTSDHPLLKDRESYLRDYTERMQPTLEEFYRKESSLKSRPALMERWAADTKACLPWFLKKKLDRELLVVSVAGDQKWGYALNLTRGTSRPVEPSEYANFDARIEMPEIVLRQAVMMNMFHHAEVSKRLHLYATEQAMPFLRLFVSVMSLKEGEVLPLNKAFSLRLLKAVLPRWREFGLYFQFILLSLQGQSVGQAEETLLAGRKTDKRAAVAPPTAPASAAS